jgi:hypothetical protein
LLKAIQQNCPDPPNLLEVSNGFCKLVTYKIEELIGTPYDHLIALDATHISTTFTLFSLSLAKIIAVTMLLQRS